MFLYLLPVAKCPKKEHLVLHHFCLDSVNVTLSQNYFTEPAHSFSSIKIRGTFVLGKLYFIKSEEVMRSSWQFSFIQR